MICHQYSKVYNIRDMLNLNGEISFRLQVVGNCITCPGLLKLICSGRELGSLARSAVAVPEKQRGGIGPLLVIGVKICTSSLPRYVAF